MSQLFLGKEFYHRDAEAQSFLVFLCVFVPLWFKISGSSLSRLGELR